MGMIHHRVKVAKGDVSGIITLYAIISNGLWMLHQLLDFIPHWHSIIIVQLLLMTIFLICTGIRVSNIIEKVSQ